MMLECHIQMVLCRACYAFFYDTEPQFERTLIIWDEDQSSLGVTILRRRQIPDHWDRRVVCFHHLSQAPFDSSWVRMHRLSDENAPFFHLSLQS